MFNLKKICAITITTVMIISVLAGCGEKMTSTSEGKDGKKDVVKVWTFPIEKRYQETFKELKSDFESKNKDVVIEVEELSWSEGMKKFDTAINAGTPPDIMFVSPSAKYVQTGLAVDIEKIYS